MQTTTDKLIRLITDDGIKTLKANQRASTLAQIEALAGVKFASVTDLYIYLKGERVWPFTIKADSVYRAWLHGKFKGRGWIVLTPSFDDLAPMQTVRVEDGTCTVGLLIGIARAEKSLAARISKAKPRKEEIAAYLQGYAAYEPAPPSPPMPETQVEDVIDADFVEVPETTKPALPAPSEQPTKPETTKPETSETTKPETTKPLNVDTVIDTPQGALEAVLAAFQKTTTASNKATLLEFREEVKIALKSVGLLQ